MNGLPISAQQLLGGLYKYYRMLHRVETLDDLNKTDCYLRLLKSRIIRANFIERAIINAMWGVVYQLQADALAKITRRRLDEQRKSI